MAGKKQCGTNRYNVYKGTNLWIGSVLDAYSLPVLLLAVITTYSSGSCSSNERLGDKCQSSESPVS